MIHAIDFEFEGSWFVNILVQTDCSMDGWFLLLKLEQILKNSWDIIIVGFVKQNIYVNNPSEEGQFITTEWRVKYILENIHTNL